MRRSVLLLALLCAMYSAIASADVPRHNLATSHARNAKLRSTQTAASGHRGARSSKASRATQPAHTKRTNTGFHTRSACGKRHPCARQAILVPERRTASATLPTRPLKHVKFALPPPMKGSHESLVRQNVRADQDGLLRIEDDDALAEMLSSHQLVALPTSSALSVDARLPANRRYCRRWTATFLADMSRAHYSRFRAPLQINSAVRTVEFQRHLQGINGNAAPAEGDIASPHLTGATIDIGKKGLSMSEIGWMRAYLLPLQSTGKIDVEEEFQQACFHISVYKSYSTARPLPASQTEPATAHHGNSSTMLAARMR